jgi:hypothetical protein
MARNAFLHITKQADGYYVSLQLPGGDYWDAQVQVSDAHREHVLGLFRAYIQIASGHAVERSPESVSTGEAIATDPSLRQIGDLLYRTFLPKAFREQLLKDLADPLVIQTTDADLPWELAYDGKRFLSVCRPLARYPVKLTVGAQPISKPASQLRFLLISADPYNDLTNVHAETALLAKDLRKAGAVCEVIGVGVATWDVAQSRLSQRNYDVIHFAGHVYFSTQDPKGCGLLLEDRQVLTCQSAEQGLGGASHPLVFINGCHSAQGTSPLLRDPNVADEMPEGLASAFIKGGAWGFIGSQWCIRDDRSRPFALEFYKGCLAWQTVGDALLRARRHCKTLDEEGYTWPAFVYFGDPTVQLVEPYKSHPGLWPVLRGWVLVAVALVLVAVLALAVVAYVARPTIGNCSPDRLPSEENVWVKLQGQRLSPGCEVVLEHPGFAAILAEEVRWNSTELVEARFDLDGAQDGFWNVVVRKRWMLPATLARSLYIEAGQERRIDSMELEILANGEHLLTVRGKGFEPNMDIVLRRESEGITVQAKEIGFISAQQLRGICSRNLAPGKWDVVGTWSDGTVSTLQEGLVILAPTSTPSPTVTLTWTPIPTLTWTPSAVHTLTVAATLTLQPSATPSPVPTPTPTARPAASRTPSPAANAIVLKEPGNGASVSGWSLRLAWEDPRPLGPNEAYDVRLATEGQAPISIGWSNKNYYEIGNEDLPAGPYAWNIVRIRLSEAGAQGSRVITAFGPESEIWHFGWRVSSGGPGKVDRDGDGYSPPEDCNDNDAAVHPGAIDPPRDRKDQNCDGKY